MNYLSSARPRHIVFFSFLTCCLVYGKPVLYAEEPETTEIIVKGATLEAPLQSVPSAVSVLSEQSLERFSDTQFSDALLQVPNLNTAGGSSQPRFFQMRGIGELEQYEGAPNTSVGFLIDGIDLSGLGSTSSLWDISQVEVFRGPQATRFGSSALAGVISLESTQPSRESQGKLRLGAGGDDLREAALAFGGAVPGTDETLRVRASTSLAQSDGFRSNPYLGRDDTNHRDEYTNRLRLQWSPTTRLEVDAVLFLARHENGYDAFAIDNSFTTQSDKPGRDALDTRAFRAQILYRLSDQWALKSISTWAHSILNYSYDADWGNDQFWSPYLPYDYQFDSFRSRNSLAEEVRLEYGDDAHYQHGESTRALLATSTRQLREATGITELASSEAYRDYDSDYRANTWATYGEGEIPLHPGTSLTFGARSEWRSTDFDDRNQSHFDFNEDFWGGSLSLNHDLTNSARAYLLVARGFRGGGFNAGTRVNEEFRRFDPEHLWNFELGSKIALPQQRATINIALFHELRRNQQVQVSYQDDPSNPASFTYITQNAARGRNSGLEVESDWKILDRVALQSSASLLWAKFTSFESNDYDLSGRDQAHAPRWQYSVGPTIQLADQLTLSLRSRGQAAYYFDDKNDQRSNAYHLFDAVLAYRYGKATFSLWGKNLGNESYATRGFYFGNEPPDFEPKKYLQRGDPRQIGLSASFLW